jgi:CMP-N-acetylneuraminic acid synthetase
VRTLGLVPARGGSGRVPRKNLVRLDGKTLVRRALETSLAAGCFETIVVSSDDDEILAEAAGLDAIALRRPEELATASALVADVARHVVRSLEEEAAALYDAVAIVQCTSPFTAPEDIAATVRLLDRTGAEAAVSVVRVDANKHPLKLKVLDGDRLLPYDRDDRLAPSQALPPLWVRNGSVYVFRRDVVERRLDAEDVRGYEMTPERSLDIDTPLDLDFARFLVDSGRVSLHWQS